MSLKKPTRKVSEAEKEMADLTRTLTPHLLSIVSDVANEKPRLCTDEVIAFALQNVCNLDPTWKIGASKSGHFFVHSQSTMAELTAFEAYSNEFAEMDRFEREDARFTFTKGAERSSFLALCETMQMLKTTSLEKTAGLDSLYIPINHSTHWSILIISVPRRTALHLDSLYNKEHQDIARRIISMLISAKLIAPYRFELKMPVPKIQSSVWECGWAVVLYSIWWSNSSEQTNFGDCKQISISNTAIVSLAKKILRINTIKERLQCYANRLSNAYDSLELFVD